MKRRTSDEERREFEQDFREGRPIRAVATKKTAKKTRAAKAPSGVNGATQDRLRRGLVEPDSRIDLHGMTQAAAHRALFAFLAGARSRGHRLVLVVTGVGNPKKNEGAEWMSSPHGVLKQMVPRWLNEPELAGLIASVSSAHVRHGGAGALYVYLRKSG